MNLGYSHFDFKTTPKLWFCLIKHGSMYMMVYLHIVYVKFNLSIRFYVKLPTLSINLHSKIWIVKTCGFFSSRNK